MYTHTDTDKEKRKQGVQKDPINNCIYSNHPQKSRDTCNRSSVQELDGKILQNAPKRYTRKSK